MFWEGLFWVLAVLAAGVSIGLIGVWVVADKLLGKDNFVDRAMTAVIERIDRIFGPGVRSGE